LKRLLSIFLFLVSFQSFAQSDWQKKHFVFYPHGFRLDQFPKTQRAKNAAKSALQRKLNYKQGLKTLVELDPDVIFIGEDHRAGNGSITGAGNIGYPKLLEDIYAAYPFSCLFFEIDGNQKPVVRTIENIIKAIVSQDHISAQEAAKKVTYSQVSAFHPIETSDKWSETDVQRTAEVMGFIVGKNSIAWSLSDDYSRTNKTLDYHDFQRRNQLIANHIGSTIRMPRSKCSKSVSLNGFSHLSGYAETNRTNNTYTLELARPIQSILNANYGVKSASILLSDGSEWSTSKLEIPSSLRANDWIIHPNFDLPLTVSEKDVDIEFYRDAFDNSKDLPIATITRIGYRTPITPDPDHRASAQYNIDSQAVMQGNIRSFDAVLYVK